MPYISEPGRYVLDRGADPRNAGEMQYVIAQLVKDYLGDDYSYQDLNDVMGALAGAQMEFYRKVVAPYEDTKIDENGGVY